MCSYCKYVSKHLDFLVYIHCMTSAYTRRVQYLSNIKQLAISVCRLHINLETTYSDTFISSILHVISMSLIDKCCRTQVRVASLDLCPLYVWNLMKNLLVAKSGNVGGRVNIGLASDCRSLLMRPPFSRW